LLPKTDLENCLNHNSAADCPTALKFDASALWVS